MKRTNEKSHRLLVRFMGLAVVLVILLLSIQSMGWFTFNSKNDISSVDIASAYVPFELGTVGNVVPYNFQTTNLDYTNAQTGNNREIKDENENPLNLSITEDDTEIKWLINDVSSFSNMSDESSEGLHPGSRGVISFYLIPKKDGALNVNFNLDLALYDSAENKVKEETVSKFAQGHILFFENYNEESRIYSGRIFDTFSYQTGDMKADTAYKKDIYWIWPDIVDELILPAGDSLFTGENYRIISENNDVDNFYSHMCDDNNKKYYFSGDSEASISDMLSNVCKGSKDQNFNNNYYKTLNKLWNNADQIIGTSAAYIELKLSAY